MIDWQIFYVGSYAEEELQFLRRRHREFGSKGRPLPTLMLELT